MKSLKNFTLSPVSLLHTCLATSSFCVNIAYYYYYYYYARISQTDGQTDSRR